jgi:hypothetical protein
MFRKMKYVFIILIIVASSSISYAKESSDLEQIFSIIDSANINSVTKEQAVGGIRNIEKYLSVLIEATGGEDAEVTDNTFQFLTQIQDKKLTDMDIILLISKIIGDVKKQIQELMEE